ncbi:hypothetical protein RQP46_010266 [Phenoliferia psychrophenolica]
MDGTMQDHAMSAPLLRQFNESFPVFHNQEHYLKATRAACYAALRLYRKPYMNDSHGLRLDFDFDPRPTELHEQFILRSATVLHHMEMAAIHNAEVAHNPIKPQLTPFDFSTAAINAHDPSIGMFAPDTLRIAILLFAIYRLRGSER